MFWANCQTFGNMNKIHSTLLMQEPENPQDPPSFLSVTTVLNNKPSWISCRREHWAFSSAIHWILNTVTSTEPNKPLHSLDHINCLLHQWVVKYCWKQHWHCRALSSYVNSHIQHCQHYFNAIIVAYFRLFPAQLKMFFFSSAPPYFMLTLEFFSRVHCSHLVSW